MLVTCEVRDSLNHSIRKFEHIVGEYGGADYARLAKRLLAILQTICWQVRSVHFLVDGRDVGSASLA